MSFTRYLTTHYSTACDNQRSIVSDPEIVEGLKTRSATVKLVGDWMRGYGLFQGIPSAQRDAVVKAFLRHSKTLKAESSPLTSTVIETNFKSLLTVLHQAVERGWISATSKLLWCLYPHDFVIYDTFVHRSLVVLQCLDAGLQNFDRIGRPSKIKSLSDIDQAVGHYMNYQAMVKHLKNEHQPILDKLRKKYDETYPYDIRIVDKLLWMIGDASTKH